MTSAGLFQSCSSLRTPLLQSTAQKSLSTGPTLVPWESVTNRLERELISDGAARAINNPPSKLSLQSRSSVRCAAGEGGEKPSSFAKQWSRAGGSSSTESTTGAVRRIAEKGGRRESAGKGDSRPFGGKDRRGNGKPARGGASGEAQRAENVDGAGADGEAREGGGSGRRERQKRSHVVQEPAEFPEPMSRDPHVAILGGGMAGLMCALGLAERGIRSTVFDTGKHGLGGRMATREVEVAGKQHLFDHAAQFFTATDARFQSHVDRWLKEGALRVWDEGHLGTLRAGGEFSELPGSEGGVRRFVSPNGMRGLCEHIMADKVRQGVVAVERPVWIGKMRARGGKWVLEETGKKAGEFDFVVIAHNGKCANRLLSPAGIPKIARQMKRLELSSIWASIIAFETPLLANGSLPRLQFDAAFVEGVPAVAWMSNNTAKLEGREQARGDAVECWTVFSSAAYGRRNKVPQENIPLARAARVKQEMLEGIAAALGRPEESLPAVLFHKIQLWGAALPVNAPRTAAGGEVECIMDAVTRVGLCGDWLIAPSVQAAAVSGLSLADKIAAFHEDAAASDPSVFSAGLDASFAAVDDAHDIGAFPDALRAAAADSKTPGVTADKHMVA
ncbi:hypothetical protein CLOP_g25021 [Closterium sp. NIES-67]|nr:hypothetical protein CLOP_g25021 [Closterium sp. NIES-67]